jgi:hypothetical protein
MNQPNTQDPFAQAITYAMSALYEKGAAKEIAKGLKMGDRIDTLADTAYKIMEIVDERTDGAVPDEQFALLAADILEEVGEIGEAAGLDYKPAEIAEAFKQMVIRFLQEQGLDTQELESAMSQVPPDTFDKVAQEDV